VDKKINWLARLVCLSLFPLLWNTQIGESFVPPIAGPIRYSRCPVDDGVTFNENDPQTWYSTAWSGRYSSASNRCEGTGGHPGADIRDRYGRQTGNFDIYAVEDGIVIRKGSSGGWGNFIAIKHNTVDGYGTVYSVYAHLANFESFIQNGTAGTILVARGQKIATMGGTGGVPRHLHFQIDRTWPSSKLTPFWP
jgi:murein DD-endopeptidase MepM/ murein hydrolase activator NlpD